MSALRSDAFVDQHVALLVLLPTSARAGVVASDSWAAAHGHGARRGRRRRLGLVLPRGGGRTAAERDRLGVLLDHAAWGARTRHHLRLVAQLDAEEPLQILLADRSQQ